MTGEHSCARCGGPVRPPGVWSNAWRCAADGDTVPVAPAGLPSPDRIAKYVHGARVPFWLPWPLPPGWLGSGLTWAGDERHGARAGLIACAGPNPLGGFSELVVIAEEPGIGLGSHWAGMPGLDPGPRLATTTGPHAKVVVAGHPTALWCVDGDPDRAVYVGEANGMWLWLIIWPAGAGALVHDNLSLVDLREAPRDLQIPLGALSLRLTPGPPAAPAG
ncbi:MAG TPA: DUF6758 family protein [Sporichthyaceae bacterium]|nr:DUF6758 family protein [Sporichthyaceae bacterium]